MITPNNSKFPPYVDEIITDFQNLISNNNYAMFEKLMKVSRGEIFILKILYKSNGSVSPTYLSDIMNTSKGRISAILNSLEKKGEIERQIDKDNRRNILVSITEIGKEHILNELSTAYQIMAQTIEHMGEKEAKEFIRLLTQFLSILNEKDTITEIK